MSVTVHHKSELSKGYRGWWIKSVRKGDNTSYVEIRGENGKVRSTGGYDGDFTHEFMQGTARLVVDGLINLEKQHLRDVVKDIEVERWAS